VTLLLLGACMTMDGFFFNASKLDAYALDFEQVPDAQVELDSFETSDGETLWGVWARHRRFSRVFLPICWARF
jgi:hypothetical protein